MTALKILGVTITGKLSMSEHVRDVVRKCAQSLHIIRVLRCLRMNDQALQDVYRCAEVSSRVSGGEELLILASCLLRRMSRNSVVEQFSDRRFVVIQEEIRSRAL